MIDTRMIELASDTLLNDVATLEPVEPLPVPLSVLEDSFALAVIEYSGNVGKAYRAVYGDDSILPAARGSTLLTDPRIVARISAITGSIKEGTLITLESHLGELAEIRDIAKQTGCIKVALTAEVSRGQAAGYYNRYKEAPIVDPINVNINVMSPSDLMGHVNRKLGNESATDVKVKGE